MYTLIEVFSQATQNKDNGILDSLDYQARIERAIKIVKDFAFKSPDDTKINELVEIHHIHTPSAVCHTFG